MYLSYACFYREKYNCVVCSCSSLFVAKADRNLHHLFLGMNVTYFFSKTNKKASSSKWDLPFWISLLPLEFWPLMFKILELKILPTKIPYQPSFLMQWWPYLRLHRKFRRHQLVCFSYQFFVLYCSQVLSNIFSVSF